MMFIHKMQNKHNTKLFYKHSLHPFMKLVFWKIFDPDDVDEKLLLHTS